MRVAILLNIDDSIKSKIDEFIKASIEELKKQFKTNNIYVKKNLNINVDIAFIVSFD